MNEGIVEEIAVTADSNVVGIAGGGGKVEVRIEAEAFVRCGTVIVEGDFHAAGVEQAHHGIEGRTELVTVNIDRESIPRTQLNFV